MLLIPELKNHCKRHQTWLTGAEMSHPSRSSSVTETGAVAINAAAADELAVEATEDQVDIALSNSIVHRLFVMTVFDIRTTFVNDSRELWVFFYTS